MAIWSDSLDPRLVRRPSLEVRRLVTGDGAADWSSSCSSVVGVYPGARSWACLISHALAKVMPPRLAMALYAVTQPELSIALSGPGTNSWVGGPLPLEEHHHARDVVLGLRSTARWHTPCRPGRGRRCRGGLGRRARCSGLGDPSETPRGKTRGRQLGDDGSAQGRLGIHQSPHTVADDQWSSAVASK